MCVLVYFSCATILLVHQGLCIRLPGQNVDKDTLTTMGIKTLGWQGEDETPFSQVHVHHNYSKVSLQNQGTNSFSQSQSQFQSSGFSGAETQGQKSVDEDDYFDLTSQTHGVGHVTIHGNNQGSGSFSQTQQTGSFPSQTSFGGQQKDDRDLDEFSQFSENDGQLLVQGSAGSKQHSYTSQATFQGQEEDSGFGSNGFSQTQSNFDQNQQLQSSVGGQIEDDYDTATSYDNNKIYNAHGYGNRLELDQVMQAENLQNQLFDDFPDYDIGQLQLVDQTAESTQIEPEERQAKHFYPVNKPIYIHGFKYPPDRENIYPENQQPPPEVHTECPNMATGQFVHSASCNQFLNCWKGRGFVQNCAPGTLFNPKTLECDFASKVQCITGPRKPEQNHYVTNEKLEISCPSEYSGVVPHHSDCSKFINCANGVEYVMDCPPGTLFSVKINNCDFPYKTECASWSVQFGNIKNYSLHSGGYSGNYQGQDNFNKYGQNKYYQSGNNRYDPKYTPSDDFRFHQGSGSGNKANQNQGSWTVTHGSTTQQNLHGHGQGSSSTNTDFYNQNILGTDQGSVSQGQSGYGGYHQTNQGSYGGYGNANSQSGYGQHQVSGQNAYGTISQSGQHQGSLTGSQGTHSQSSVGQGGAFYGQLSGQNHYQQSENQEQQLYGQSHDLSGNQNQYGYGTNQQSYGQNHGNTNLQSETQNYYDQNQDLTGTQSQYLHGNQNQNQNHYQQNGNQGQQLHGQHYHGQNQELQGQYHHGQGQSQSFYQQGIDKNQNLDADSSSSKISGSGKVKCADGATGLFPHPSDCSKFLNCANGQTFVQDCGPGTVFNPDSKVCDFPYKVKCSQSEDYHHLINVRTEPVNHQGAGTHGYYTSQGNNNHNSAASGQWQSGQSVDGSSSKHQNQHYGVGSNTQTSSGVYQEDFDSSSSSEVQNHYSSGGVQKSSTAAKCPPHASGLYPHPTICSKFLNCDNGQTFIQDCGPGTVFNPVSSVCDFPYNVECGGNYGEGLINIRTTLLINKTEGQHEHGSNTNQGHGNSNWQDQQQGSYGQNTLVGGSTTNQQGFYGQGSSSATGQHVYGQNSGVGTQQQGYGQNQNTLTGGGTTNQHGFYGQGSSSSATGQHVGTDGQQEGSYGQNTNTLTGASGTNQQGSYGQGSSSGHHSGIGTQQQGSYGQKQNPLTGVGTTNQQGFYGQGSSSSATGQHVYGQSSGTGGQQQGSYGQSQFSSSSSGTTGQQGSTWVNKNQQGLYGQNKVTDEDQELQESKNYNQQFYGSNQGQNSNNQQGQSQSGNRLKPHHSPPPFPSTDINADYEFGNEGVTLEAGAKPKVPKPYSKRKDFCEPLDFHCSVDDCIPQSMICDGVKDCPNGLDEQGCGKYLREYTMIPNTILAVREKERYLNISLIYCAKSCLEAKGFQCKSFSYRKDDGACFLADTNVGNSGALIISHPYNYYEAKTFSVNCTNLYKCPSQKCINFKQVCDGINDCGDRTDEKGCSAEAFGYQIRLHGTDKKHEGRIEVKAFGKWGYVCDDKFGLRDADVVCREIGFPLGSLEVKANSFYAKDLNDDQVFYLMDDVTCLGNETTIRDCDFNGWGVSNCESQEVVGVVCKTPLEVCPKDYWKCDSAQECIPLSFVCDGVFDCTDQSDERDQHCEAPIELRLVNGKSKYEGRVEIRYHGIWGTICDDDFNDDSAKVVCKHLGYPGQAVSKKDGFFGPGNGPIWLDQVFCQGNESALEHCVHWNWGEHNCEHAEDVGVICSNVYDDIGIERSVKLDQRHQINEVLPEYLFPERCGLRKDDQFLEDDAVHFRVVKGSSATKGDYPWQASLRIKNKSKPTHWCGAVVISQKFVLTAAHCLAGFAKGAYFIVAGDYNTDDDEGTEQEAYIDEFYIHEEFRSGHKMNNDIAVIKLKGTGLTFTKDVQPICLPEADLEYGKGLNCTISGFGSIESGKSGYSHQLRAGWVPLQSREVCQMPHVYGSSLTEGMICAGSLDEGIDACDGDSGGPLACLHDGLFTLYGLTSWGHHCGFANKPGVYVKVSHYRKWIDETIRKHS